MLRLPDRVVRQTPVVLLIVLTFLLRFWNVGEVEMYAGDQGIMIPATHNYIMTGRTSPDGWEHPPMKYFLLKSSMLLFGNNMYGWRMKNVLFGTGVVLVLYFLGWELFRDRRIALFAGLLAAIDPTLLFFSQTSHGETSSVFFFLAAVVLMLRFLSHRLATPIPTGICLGLALGQKWYYFFGLGILIGFSILAMKRANRLGLLEMVHLLSALVGIPIIAYLLAYYPWFGRGYSLTEFASLQSDMFRTMQNLELDMFTTTFAKIMPSNPWLWFVKPLIGGMQLAPGRLFSRFLIFMNNPPVWILALPSLAWITYHAWKSKKIDQALVPCLFLAMYLQFLLVDRPIFLYSAIIVVPFAFLAVSATLMNIIDRLPRPTVRFWQAFGAVVAWGLYTFPFVMHYNVPAVFYTPLIAVGTIIR